MTRKAGGKHDGHRVINSSDPAWCWERHQETSARDTREGSPGETQQVGPNGTAPSDPTEGSGQLRGVSSDLSRPGFHLSPSSAFIVQNFLPEVFKLPVNCILFFSYPQASPGALKCINFP